MQSTATKLRSPALRIAQTLVGMSGIRLDHKASTAIAATLGIVASASLASHFVTTPARAKAYALFAWMLYYPGHIAFFKFGLHDRLRRHFKTEDALGVYYAFLGVLFFNQGLCQMLFVEHHVDPFPWAGPASFTFIAGGVGVLSFLIKTWATWEVGLDVYYYRDLFCDAPQSGGLVASGPYALFENPMYGIGLLTMYGTSISAGSTTGVALSLFFHLSIYAFYFTVEKPFIRRAYPPLKP